MPRRQKPPEFKLGDRVIARFYEGSGGAPGRIVGHVNGTIRCWVVEVDDDCTWHDARADQLTPEIARAPSALPK